MTVRSALLEHVLEVIHRQSLEPCAMRRTGNGMGQLARLYRDIPRLERREIFHQVAPAVDRLLIEGHLCTVCRWKICLIASCWFRDLTPILSIHYRGFVPSRSSLIKAGRDLEEEVHQALDEIRPWDCRKRGGWP